MFGMQLIYQLGEKIMELITQPVFVLLEYIHHKREMDLDVGVQPTLQLFKKLIRTYKNLKNTS